MPEKIFLYDTTLRDGTQSEDVNFTVNDKIRVTSKLIDFGMDCIEGGWPGSNKRDEDFFNSLKSAGIDKSKISAFSSTRRANKSCDNDEIIQSLLASDVPNLTVFGKSWTLHVDVALKISLEQNLELIYDTITYLKKRVNKVYFDAEHFFDGYKASQEYALKVLKTAAEAGADALILCETNGGAMPDFVSKVAKNVTSALPNKSIGIHCHNDCELAVANSIAAVLNGANHVQGTINGLGERCGNANLISIIPNLQIKYGYDCVSEKQLSTLKELSLFVSEIGNLSPLSNQPYVGRSAFAHKGGVHVSAMMKDATTYEHITPDLVGNKTRVLLSDLSGKSNLIYKLKESGLEIPQDDKTVSDALEKMKSLENQGYEFEGAEGSFELMLLSIAKKLPEFFKLISYRVIDEKRSRTDSPMAEATVMVEVNEIIEHTAATGNGPVNALDNALRKALIKFYPSLSDMSLVDYKVRILSSTSGTSALTRVLIESKDSNFSWGTVGVASNIIDASYQALVDSIQYKLWKESQNS